MHNLFDEWNEISSYIFGFWLADGYIWLCSNGKRYYKRWGICAKDEQIINDIAGLLDLEKRKPRKDGLYYIEKNSNRLFDFCYEVVGGTDKSHSEFGLPDIPDAVFHHFVRGFFDGDGSIHWKSYKNRHGNTSTALQTSFTGGLETNHIDALKEKLRMFIPVGNKKITCNKSKKLVFNQYDSMLLCEWMYDGASICLTRKKEIWDKTDKKKLRESKKFFSNKV